MHKHTKLAPALRQEVYETWKKSGHSIRSVAEAYHVDKRVVQRIIERGEAGDFSVHSSTNHRYLAKSKRPKLVRKRTKTTPRRKK